MFDYSLYDDCIYEEGFRRRLGGYTRSDVTVDARSDVTADARSDVTAAPNSEQRFRGGLNDYACPGNAMNLWLDRKDVRAALRKPPSPTPSPSPNPTLALATRRTSG